MRIPHLLPAVAALTLALAACAPSTSSDDDGGGDAKTGTLKVWLYDEANRAAKEEVINAAIEEFTADREDVQVDVQYIASDESRFEKFKGAFNDPASSPDVAEYGNTDLPSYVEARGLADLTGEADEATQDISEDLMRTATVDGKVYGVPWFIGIRALYYRTDVFDDLGLDPPKTQRELTEAAREIREADSKMVGIAVGGNYTFGMAPFLWSHGGDFATESDGGYTSVINSPESRSGLRAYTDLMSDDICPPKQCAEATGGKTVEMFASGTAGMAILPNISRSAVEEGEAKGKYDVVPLPGREPGSVAPAFAGGNNLGVFANAKRATLAREFVELLAGAKYQQRMYDAMGNLPTLTEVRDRLTAEDPFLDPFVKTMQEGTRFVPVTPAWSAIDAQSVVQNAMQKIASGRADVQQATDEAAEQMDQAFAGS